MIRQQEGVIYQKKIKHVLKIQFLAYLKNFLFLSNFFSKSQNFFLRKDPNFILKLRI